MRIDNIWMYMYEWKEFICLAVVCIIAIAVIIPLLTERFDYRQGNKYILPFLYQRGYRESVYIAAVILEVIFVLSCILFQKEIEINCLMYLAFSGITVIVTGRKWKLIITEILNSAFLFAVLLCDNIMFRFLQEVRMDGMVLILYVMLNILAFTYLVYYFVWHMLELKYRESEEETEDEEEMLYEE